MLRFLPRCYRIRGNISPNFSHRAGRMFNDRCDLRRYYYDTSRACQFINLHFSMLQHNETHATYIYIQIRRGREFIGSLWQKMRAVAFKPVIGIVRQWQPDCYHTPFSLQPNICATCFRKLHSRFISPPLHFFIALDYRIYSIDRKLFWDRSVYQQRKQPRNFLIQSGNTGFLENTIQSS